MATEIKKVYDIRLLGADAVLKNMQSVNSEFDKAKKLVQALQQTALKNEHLIVDPEKIKAEKAQLEEKLIRYSDSTTTQIVVITIESLKIDYFII